MKKSIFIIIVSIFTTISGQNSSIEAITCAFWNAENLFDLYDDSEKSDEEFALGGRKNCTQEIFDLKLKNLTEVLSDLNADILGLCEVENRFVLDQLNASYTGRDYSIVHMDSPDERGIDVALLYDPEMIRVLSTEAIHVNLPDGGATRDILYVRGMKAEHELHLFVNHWPSKYGGVEKTIPLRAATAETLRGFIDGIFENDINADIIIMGDLNDEPFEPSIVEHLGAELFRDQQTDSFVLTNLMTQIHDDPQSGTYMWRGEHDVIDHIVVSRGILDKSGWFSSIDNVSVLDKPKYRQQEGNYKDYPFRFWAGNNLLGGYSDHMAIQIKLYIEN